MSNLGRANGRRVRRGRVFGVEVLEGRQLLAADALTWPSLSGFIQQALAGQDTAKPAINTMLKALQRTLTDGPLADLKAGAITGDGFVVDVQSVVASFDASVNSQLHPRFPNVDELLRLQGLRMSNTVASLNEFNALGLSTSTGFETGAEEAINSLTTGPIFSLGTKLSGYATATQVFEARLRFVANSLDASGLTSEEASSVVQAEAEAYRSTIYAGLLLNNSDFASRVGAAVSTLESTARSMAGEDEASALAALDRAIATFDTAVLDTSGLFGPNGYAGIANAKYGYIPQSLAKGRTASIFTDVNGTATFGGPATLTASLSSVDGSPVAGQVLNFTIDGVYAGTAVTDSTGLAILENAPNFLASGHATGAIVVAFAGSDRFRTSTGTGDIEVNQSSTTTTLTSSANPSSFGQSLTFTATVAPAAPGSGTPTGTVNFFDGTTTLGTGTINASGVATFSTSDLSVGSHSITAVYAGSSNFTESTSAPLSQQVNPATTTALTSSVNPSITGESVTFTATVSPASGTGTPTGTVTFRDGTTTLGTGTVNASGVATFSTTGLTIGTHSVTAVYGGDSSFGSSTSPAVSQVVNQASTSTALISSSNPSTFGQSVTYTATVSVTSPGTGTPTGTVNFFDGATLLGSGTLSASRTASFSTSTFTPGSHSITAVYVGTTNFATSTSPAVTQVVNQSSTTTTIAANPASTNVEGQPTVFTATVAAVSPGLGTPTGTVNFFDNTNTLLGTGTLNSGRQATFSTNSLSEGDHSISATYVGDTNFLTSNSSALPYTITATT